MNDQDFVERLQAIIDNAKALARSGDTVVTPWARQILTCAYTALQAKSPTAAIGDLIDYE